MPQPSSFGLTILISILIASVVCGTLYVITYHEGLGYLGGDSEHYLVFAESIRQGTVFDKLDPHTAHRGLFIRPPGYPLVLAFAEIIAPHNLLAGITASHFILLAVCLSISALLLSGQLRPFIVGLAVVPSALRMIHFFPSNLSEWTTFCLLLVVVSWIARIRYLNSPRSFLGLGVTISALCLVKPAFLFLIAGISLWIILKRDLRAGVWCGVGLLPLFLWSTINFHRTGSFSIAQQFGFASFYVASLIGESPIDPRDPPRLSECLKFLNEHREKGTSSSFNEAKRFFAPGLPNNQRLISSLLTELKYTWPEVNSCLSTYSLRAIREHPDLYLTHLWYGIQIFRFSLIEFGMIVFLMWRTRRRHLPLMQAIGMSAISIHVGYIGTVIATQVVIPRYYLLTAQLLWFAIALGFACWIRELVAEGRAAKSLC